jgi:hypothetical protein
MRNRLAGKRWLQRPELAHGTRSGTGHAGSSAIRTFHGTQANLPDPGGLLIPVPLLIVGLVQLRRAVPGWRWPAAWTGVMAVAITLATVLVLAIAHALQPSGISYPVLAQLSWGWLTLIIAFIATAAAMTWVLRALRPAGYSVNVG